MTDPSDPYRYGAPEPGLPAQEPINAAPATRATGKQILTSSWRLLRQDPELLALPVLGLVATLFAAAVLFVPGWLLGSDVSNSTETGLWIGGVLAAFAASVVGIFFQAALVIGANERADGRTPTFGGSLAAAWQMKGRIVAWALVTTTVGIVVRAVEERLGILGRLLGFLAGLAWAVVSFLVVPVLVAEQLGPIDAVKRSGQLIRGTWGTGLRTTLRFGLIQLAAVIPVVILMLVSVGLLGSGALVAGSIVLAVAVLALFAFGTVTSAVTTYAQAMIYRYAVGRPVPGLPDGLLAGAFAPRRRRGRRGR